MQCPFCGQRESKVIDSRDAPESIRRRRECLSCGLRFTTYERVHTMPLIVVKRDSRQEPFDAQKLFRSIRIACAKRALEIGALDKMVVDIENELHRLGRAEVPSRVIGEIVMERLRGLDRVAYIRFASVYRDFDDIDTFAREVEALQANDGRPPVNQLALLPDDAPHRTARKGAGRRRGRRATGAAATRAGQRQ